MKPFIYKAFRALAKLLKIIHNGRVKKRNITKAIPDNAKQYAYNAAKIIHSTIKSSGLCLAIA